MVHLSPNGYNYINKLVCKSTAQHTNANIHTALSQMAHHPKWKIKVMAGTLHVLHFPNGISQ